MRLLLLQIKMQTLSAALGLGSIDSPRGRERMGRMCNLAGKLQHPELRGFVGAGRGCEQEQQLGVEMLENQLAHLAVRLVDLRSLLTREEPDGCGRGRTCCRA